MTFTITSQNYQNVRDEHVLKSNLDRDLKNIYQSHQTLDGVAIKAPTFGGGFAVQSGTAFVQNGQMLGIATGLTKVNQVVVTPNAGNGVPLNIWITAQPSPTKAGAIDIFIFKPTSNADNTPVLATGTAYSVHWYATGTAGTQ